MIYPYCMVHFENRPKTYAYDRLFKKSVFTEDALDFNLNRQSNYLKSIFGNLISSLNGSLTLVNNEIRCNNIRHLSIRLVYFSYEIRRAPP